MSNDRHQQNFAAAMMNVQEIMNPVVDAVAGYRSQLVSAGFSPEVAEQMSVDYHSTLLSMFLKGARS